MRPFLGLGHIKFTHKFNDASGYLEHNVVGAFRDVTDDFDYPKTRIVVKLDTARYNNEDHRTGPNSFLVPFHGFEVEQLLAEAEEKDEILDLQESNFGNLRAALKKPRLAP